MDSATDLEAAIQHVPAEEAAALASIVIEETRSENAERRRSVFGGPGGPRPAGVPDAPESARPPTSVPNSPNDGARPADSLASTAVASSSPEPSDQPRFEPASALLPASASPIKPPQIRSRKSTLSTPRPSELTGIVRRLDAGVGAEVGPPEGVETSADLSAQLLQRHLRRGAFRRHRSDNRKRRTTVQGNLMCIVVAILLGISVYASFVDDFMGDVEAGITCGTCLGLLLPLKALAHVGDDVFVDTFVNFCTKLGIEDEEVCRGAVGQQAPILAHDLRSISVVSHAAKSFCSSVFGLCPMPEVLPYDVPLPPLPPRRVELDITPEDTQSSAPRPPLRVVHISDVHIDRKYTPGSDAICSRVLCCRPDGMPHPLIVQPAGPFGNAHCDSPESLVKSMFSAINDVASDRDFTLFTGDVIESAVWEVSSASVSHQLSAWHGNMDGIYEGDKLGVGFMPTRPKSFPAIVDESRLSGGDRIDGSHYGGDVIHGRGVGGGAGIFRTPAPGTTTPGPKEAPSYPAVGNHDIAPVNGFPRMLTILNANNVTTQDALPSVTWIFDLLSHDWQHWIGKEASFQVATQYGCYSVVHPGTTLRIISVNTQYWYKQNFWLYDSDAPVWDPNGILTWLAHELYLAESAGQRAWIIGHMSFGKLDAMRDQSNYANQIFHRFRHTIAAHFYGHSHSDELELGYTDFANRTAETASGVSYIAGALTPLSGNPVFRVYDVDPVSYEIQDFTVYIANQSEPSFRHNPRWERYYSAREAYDLGGAVDAYPTLNASYWHRVTEDMERNATLFQEYILRRTRGTTVKRCASAACRHRTICGLRAMRSEDNCAAVRPGLSFKETKEADNVDVSKRDQIPMSRGVDEAAEEDDYPHEDHACEGPGLASLLRKLAEKHHILSLWRESVVQSLHTHWHRVETLATAGTSPEMHVLRTIKNTDSNSMRIPIGDDNQHVRCDKHWNCHIVAVRRRKSLVAMLFG